MLGLERSGVRSSNQVVRKKARIASPARPQPRQGSHRALYLGKRRTIGKRLMASMLKQLGANKEEF